MSAPQRRPVLESRESRQAATGALLFVVAFWVYTELGPNVSELLGWALWLLPMVAAGALVNRWWAPLLAVIPFGVFVFPMGVDCAREWGTPVEDDLFLSSCWLGAAFAVSAAITAAFLAAGVVARRVPRWVRRRRRPV